MINPMDLSGKHILITGGSSGIGRQCAVQASRLGARVTLIARNEERLKETIERMDRPEEQACYPFDLNRTEGIENLVRTIIEERGSVDGFVHAAGIATSRMLKQTNPKFVEKMFRIHVYALIELVRCLSLKDHLHDGASLVTVSSCAAKVGNVSQGAYAAAKAGMEGFLNPVALELGHRGIRFNAVAYAFVMTDMTKEFLDYGDHSLLSAQYLGFIDVESAANAVVFLLSDACRYITATVLPVSGGYGGDIMEASRWQQRPLKE